MAVRSLAQSSIRQNPQLNSMLAGYQTNAFHHLETVRLGGAAASVSFTNLSRYADYQHLQIRSISKSNRSAETEALALTFNGDSNANYAFHVVNTFAGSTGSSGSSSTTRIEVGSCGANEAGRFFPAYLDILDAFSTDKNKTIKFIGGSQLPTFPNIAFTSGLWMSTAAISTITLQPIIGTTLLPGSRFSLYGIKARA
jgi:hypothetical protein